MASGQTHAKVAGVVGTTLVGIAIYVAGNGYTQAAIGLIIGAIGGLLITPDIDHWVRTHEEYRVYRYLGSLAGKLWQSYWSPYATFIPHRHWLSHLPGIGTALRIFYLSIPVWIGWYWFGWIIPIEPDLYWAAFIAWTVQDTFHWIFDGFGRKD